MAGNQLNTQLLRRLECPVCFDTCLPPIYMCTNGHAVCAKCQPKLTKCGTCRAPGKMTARCLALESIAELVTLPCPNQPRGCRQMLKYAEIDEHLKRCGYRCRICNEWRYSAQDIKTHVMQNHMTMFSHVPPSGIMSMHTSVPVQKESFDKTNVAAFGLHGDMFWLESKYTSATGIYSKTLRIVSHDDKDASRYCYSVHFESNDPLNSYSLFCRANVLTEGADGDRHLDVVLPKKVIEACTEGWINYNLAIIPKQEGRGGPGPSQAPPGGTHFRGQHRGKNRGRGQPGRKIPPLMQPGPFSGSEK